MVKLTQEIWADPRFSTLQESMSWSRAQTLGTLLLTWDATRRLRKTALSAAEVCAALGGVAREKPALLQALLDAGYLCAHAGETETFEFPDNAQWLALSASRAENGRSEGKAKKRRVGRPFIPVEQRAPVRSRSRKAVAPPVSTPTPVAAPPAAAVPAPVAAAAVAGPADDGRADAKVNKAASREANAEAWNAYTEAYVMRYRVAPLRNARTNGMVANFVSRVGKAASPDVLRFFLKHDARDYVARQHDLGMAVRDAEALHTQWCRGEAVTPSSLRDAENRSRLEGQLFRLGQLHAVPG